MHRSTSVIVFLLGCHLPNWLSAQTADLLSSRFTEAELHQVLVPRDQWVPFPALADRAGWMAADQTVLAQYHKKALEYLDYQWPGIAATTSLRYVRDGDRDEYQAASFEKRRVLGTMILAEIYEHRGRFIDPIVNGIWSICEESFWGVPAHLPASVQGLGDVADPVVDLFAAETATFLAWADYFLGAAFDQVTPQIRKRIRHETQSRIFQPLMAKYHGWMGPTSSGRAPNNWNPWICSNWINVALLL